MANNIRIKNNKSSELILGAVQIMKQVHAADSNGALIYDDEMKDGKLTGRKFPVMREAQDYVRAAEVIRPGQMSEPLTEDQLKAFETPVMNLMKDNGEIEIILNGRSLRPRAPQAPAPSRSLVAKESVSDEVAEASSVTDILGGTPVPVKD